jgi:HlyD family secretion protein
VVPASQIGLNFGVSGRLIEIDASVGQRVSAGQVVARLDSDADQALVDAAQASLDGAQAVLRGVLNPLDPASAADLRAAVAAAQIMLNDTMAAVNLQNQQDAAAIAAADQRLSNAQQRYSADGCSADPPPTVCSQDQAAVTEAQNTLATNQSRQQSDAASGQTRVDQARSQLIAAQVSQSGRATANPSLVARAQADVAAAGARLQAAKAALAKTVLTAPIDGLLLRINGRVGEVVGAGPSASAAAPGSSAPLPSPQAGSDTLAVNSTAFMVLGGSEGQFAIVVPFAEGDAVRLAAGQQGNLTWDAIPGLQTRCRVVAVAATSTVVAGAVEYYTTVAPDTWDPRLKEGMTANVSITVGQGDNVLAVPNQALYSRDDRLFVDVWFNGRPLSTPVTAGMIGNSVTEITSGLNRGQQVVLSARHGLPTSGALPGTSPP